MTLASRPPLNEAPSCYDESGVQSAVTMPDALDVHLDSTVPLGLYIAQLFRSVG